MGQTSTTTDTNVATPGSPSTSAPAPPPASSANAAVRLNRLFLAALTIGFGAASIAYATMPARVVAQFAEWDVLLGGTAGGYPEPQCRVWVSLAAANVATLSLMSLLLLRDLRRNRAVWLPLLFMKSASAVLFLLWWLASPGARSLLVAAAADLATAAAIFYLPRRALAALDGR